MKGVRNLKKSRRKLVCVSICLLALTGCSMNSYATTTAAVPAETQQERPPKDSGVLAKITSVDSRTITVTLADKADMPEGDPAQGDKNNGTAPPDKPEDGMTPPEEPEEGASPPEKPADDNGQTRPENGEQEKPEMNFNGESKTYTIPDSAVITKGMEQESASFSDLTVDTVVRITLDGDTVSSVSIMN